jgi:hypothetical protein
MSAKMNPVPYDRFHRIDELAARHEGFGDDRLDDRAEHLSGLETGAEQQDAPERGGLLRISDEAG